LNSVLIEGRVQAKPVLEEAPNGSLICKFNIKSIRFEKKGRKGKKGWDFERKVSFFSVSVSGKQAEILTKGRGVRVIARLRKLAGSEMEIIGEHVELKPEPPAKKFLDPREVPGKAFELDLSDEEFDRIWPSYRQEVTWEDLPEGHWWHLDIPSDPDEACQLCEAWSGGAEFSFEFGERDACLKAIISAGMVDKLIEC
jgi:hypothetical protein